MFKYLAPIVLGFFAVIFSANGVELNQPQQIVETTANQIKQKLLDKRFANDFAQLTAYVGHLIDSQTDFELIASLVLGKLWKQASVLERSRFQAEFRLLLVRTYARSFMSLKDWSIQYLPNSPQTEDNKALVRTQLIQAGQAPLKIDYRMLNRGDGWKTYDIIIDGVSIVTNYRTLFKNQAEQSNSLASIIQSLQDRNKQALAVPGPQD